MCCDTVTDTAKKLKVFPQQHSLHKFCTHITVFITLSFVPASPRVNAYKNHEAVLYLYPCGVCWVSSHVCFFTFFSVQVKWDIFQSLSWGEDGLLLLWDMEHGQLLQRMVGHQEVGAWVMKCPELRWCHAFTNLRAPGSELSFTTKIIQVH